VIEFAPPVPGRVKLAVYNLVGQIVATLATGERRAGTHQVRWDGRDQAGEALASGLYLYRLEVGEWSETRSLMLLR